MPGKPTNKKRQAANQRLAESFLASTKDTINELLELVDDPDLIDTVVEELRRLSQTALSLEKSEFSAAAASAADSIGAGDDPAHILGQLAGKVSQTTPRNQVGVLFVAADGQLAHALNEQSNTIPEDLRVFENIGKLRQALQTKTPEAVIVPTSAMDLITTIANTKNYPVFSYGSPSDWDARLDASRSGAAGHLSTPFALSDLTRMVRQRVEVHRPAMEVVLLADETSERQRLQAALEALGISVVATGQPSELLPLMDSGMPQAVIMGAQVGAIDAQALAIAVRNHGQCASVPILVVGRPKDPAALRKLGVDDVMRSNADPMQMAGRVVDRIVRIRTVPITRYPDTGLWNRAGVLGELDRAMARTRRRNDILGIGIFDLVGITDAVDRFGLDAGRKARQLSADMVKRTLRSTDIIGELKPGTLLIGMPTASKDQVLRRLTAVSESLLTQFATDFSLKSLVVKVGTSDSSFGMDGVVQRAERNVR